MLMDWSLHLNYGAEGFAIFRYGAKELPFVVMMAAGLSSAMLTQFSKKEDVKESLGVLRKKSLRIMHWTYPLSIAFLLFAKPIYKGLFSPEFTRSADVFVIYLLAIVSRVLFPHTILIGLKKTRTLFRVSVIEVVLNIILSLWLVHRYGVVGVALATVVTYVISKSILILYNYIKLGYKPNEYIPVKWYAFYSFVLAIIFVLLDRGIMVI
jgi:O-antigen/teichoic acid export membrane protein